MSTPLLVRHVAGCPVRAFAHTDAAKRVSDAVNLHYAAIGWDVTRYWIAVKLADGTGGNQLYDSKRDAVRHQPDEFLCAYIKLQPGMMPVCDAEIILKTHRLAYNNGYRMADPDSRSGGRDIIPRVAYEHNVKIIRGLRG